MMPKMLISRRSEYASRSAGVLKCPNRLRAVKKGAHGVQTDILGELPQYVLPTFTEHPSPSSATSTGTVPSTG